TRILPANAALTNTRHPLPSNLFPHTPLFRAEALRDTRQHSPYGPSNLPDRQVATIEFENGTQATFTAVMAQPRTTRRIRVFGTEDRKSTRLKSSHVSRSYAVFFFKKKASRTC